MNVTGFDELAALVNQDKASNVPSATRYPVRFIFVKDVWTVKNIVEMLKQRSAMVVDVSNVFPLNFSSDGFPTASTLLQEISTQDGDLVVVSAGNLIRFWSDDEFGLLVSSLMEFFLELSVRVSRFNTLGVEASLVYSRSHCEISLLRWGFFF